MAERPNGVTSLVVLLLAITSHLYCLVVPFAVTSCHLPFAMLASHSEINCTSEQPGTGSCGVLNIAQSHNIASKSKRT